MELYLAQFLSFTAVLFFVIGIDNFFKDSQQPTTQTLNIGDDYPWIIRFFEGELYTIGKLIYPCISVLLPFQSTRLTRLIQSAGIGKINVHHIYGLQFASSIVLGGATCGLTLYSTSNTSLIFLFSLIPGIIGWLLPLIWLNRKSVYRLGSISNSLPFSIDLLTVSLEAGQDFGAAVRFLINEGPKGPLASEFAIMLRETTLGKSRVEALKDMADRVLLDEFQSLVATIVHANQTGAGLSKIFKLQAEEMRRAQNHKAERKAARTPCLLILPIALFILPAVFIIILAPLGMKFKGIM